MGINTCRSLPRSRFLLLCSTLLLAVPFIQAFPVNPSLTRSVTNYNSRTSSESFRQKFTTSFASSQGPPLASVAASPDPTDPTTIHTISMKSTTKECFRGQTVLLTGASGGLGRSLALSLAEAGAGTLLLTARRKEALEQVAAECKSLSSTIKIVVLTCDLSDPASVADLAVRALQACPTGIDVLVNNGGVSSRSNFVDTDISVDQKVMQINFLAGAALAKAVVPGMIAKGAGGKIIWISSVQGLLAIPSRTSYAASKFAVQGYCDSLRAELAVSNITVHVISPGYIRTNLSLSAITGDGTAHGKIDAATAKGADPVDVAVATLDSVAANQAELIVAADFSAKIAMWLRLLFPGLLRYLLVKRFKKSLAKEKSD